MNHLGQETWFYYSVPWAPSLLAFDVGERWSMSSSPNTIVWHAGTITYELWEI